MSEIEQPSLTDNFSNSNGREPEREPEQARRSDGLTDRANVKSLQPTPNITVQIAQPTSSLTVIAQPTSSLTLIVQPTPSLTVIDDASQGAVFAVVLIKHVVAESPTFTVLLGKRKKELIAGIPHCCVVGDSPLLRCWLPNSHAGNVRLGSSSRVPSSIDQQLLAIVVEVYTVWWYILYGGID